MVAEPQNPGTELDLAWIQQVGFGTLEKINYFSVYNGYLELKFRKIQKGWNP